MSDQDFNLKNIFPIFITAMIDFIGFRIIIPIGPYYVETFHGNPVDFSILLVVYSAAQFVASPYLGRLSDRFGRKKVLSVGLSGEIFGYLIFGLSPFLFLLYIGRLITGATSGNLPVLYSFVSDKTDAGNRTRAIGLIGAAIGIGFVIGPAIGGLLSIFGYRVPILFAGFLSLFNLILVQRLREEKKKTKYQKRSVIEAFKTSPYLFMSIAAIAVGFVMLQTVLAFYGQALYNWTSLIVGILLAVIGIQQAIYQIGIVPKLVSKIGLFKTIIIGIFSFILSFILLSFRMPEYISIVSLSLFAFGYSLFQTPVISYVSQLALDDSRGASLGITQSAQSLASIIGPLIAGYLFYSISKFIPFQMSAIMGVISVILFWITIRSNRNNLTQQNITSELKNQ